MAKDILTITSWITLGITLVIVVSEIFSVRLRNSRGGKIILIATKNLLKLLVMPEFMYLIIDGSFKLSLLFALFADLIVLIVENWRENKNGLSCKFRR